MVGGRAFNEIVALLVRKLQRTLYSLCGPKEQGEESKTYSNKEASQNLKPRTS